MRAGRRLKPERHPVSSSCFSRLWGGPLPEQVQVTVSQWQDGWRQPQFREECLAQNAESQLWRLIQTANFGLQIDLWMRRSWTCVWYINSHIWVLHLFLNSEMELVPQKLYRPEYEERRFFQRKTMSIQEQVLTRQKLQLSDLHASTTEPNLDPWCVSPEPGDEVVSMQLHPRNVPATTNDWE